MPLAPGRLDQPGCFAGGLLRICVAHINYQDQAGALGRLQFLHQKMISTCAGTPMHHSHSVTGGVFAKTPHHLPGSRPAGSATVASRPAQETIWKLHWVRLRSDVDRIGQIQPDPKSPGKEVERCRTCDVHFNLLHYTSALSGHLNRAGRRRFGPYGIRCQPDDFELEAGSGSVDTHIQLERSAGDCVGRTGDLESGGADED